MGIHCEINLFKPEDGAFTPGSTVQGTIKYCLDEDTVFKRIVVSLKGSGHLSMRRKDRNRNKSMTLRNHEDYVDEKSVIHDDEEGQKALPVGSYEATFSFQLPEKIPPTLHCFRNQARYAIRCNLAYYIKIKFEKPAFFSFNKKFKKEITVVSGITPRLPNVPTVCGEQSSLMRLFSGKKSIINIKATIKNSVLRPGDKIELDYEINNDAHVDIKSIETVLTQVYNFTSHGGRTVTGHDEVKDTDSKTGSIKSGESKTMSMEINIPSDVSSLEYSKIVSRDYVVRITAGLPMPHRNVVLEIPVQIGEIDVQSKYGYTDAPPSYWEAMGETEKSDDDDVDDEEGSAEEKK